MDKAERLVSFVNERFGETDSKKVQDAINLAYKMLDGIVRYNGQPFVMHSIGVSLIVAEEIGLLVDSIIASVLHDVSRMRLVSDDEIKKHFGNGVMAVLDGMNSISRIETNTDKEQTEFFKDLIVSLSSNPRVILIKMADRLEVMRSIDAFPPEKRAKKSWETLHIYSQIAHKLGLYNLKSEMEDLSLKCLEPEEVADIERKLIESKTERENFIAKFIEPIKKGLDAKKVQYAVKGRTKSVYSIWRKMTSKRIAYEDVYDVFAIRIVIDCPIEEEKGLCWHAFSIVTDTYKANTKRMRDWVSIPKSNGYESLHTTVVTDSGKWVEVQIRTKRMDDVAECGIAAHWRYKGVQESEEVDSQEWLDKLRAIIDGVDVSGGGISFSGNIEQTTKEIFAFTPNGDLRKLPKGATLLDFAYDIHTTIGNTCVGGRVNHRNVTIREEIKSGDLVEITTSKNQVPRRDWLNIVCTSKARSRIKSYLREQQNKDANMGREELERKLKNWKINLELEESCNILCKHYKQKTVVDIYNMIATDELDILDVKEVLVAYIARKNIAKQPEERVYETKKIQAPINTDNKDTLVIGGGLSDIKYQFSKCCTPIFGDQIFGFITVLKGISIHRKDCSNGVKLVEQYPYRVIDVQWQGDASEQLSTVKIHIVSDDVMGLEFSIKQVLNTLSVELRGISTDYSRGMVESTITVGVLGKPVVDSIVYLLKQISGVKKVLPYK